MLRISEIPEDGIMFYDVETEDQYATYTSLTMTAVQYGLNSEPELVETPQQRVRFRNALRNPDMLKVNFNGTNFDNIVLYRHGFAVCETNHHDMFLAMKTIAPNLPAYSQKFISWFYFGDPHFPEMELEGWARRNKKDKWSAPKEILGPYNKWDIIQLVRIFCMAWEVVQRPEHWHAYTTVEMPVALPFEEMMLRGGLFLDAAKISEELASCENRKKLQNIKAFQLTDGEVTNANSNKQVGRFLDLEGFHVELTEKGMWSLPKAELMDLRDQHPLAECTFQVRRLNNEMAYYRNYLEALAHSPEHSAKGWIPVSYSTSRARTRRILSDSKYGINFQNPTKAAKKVQMVPPGWLGWWWDATQIENVVHIYESNDVTRRVSYEADPDWSEYVWLCNKILGTNLTKDELDDIARFPSPVNPSWSVYKQFKTVKLALNFGMGVPKYCAQTGLPRASGESAFNTVQRACPAIKGLQAKLIKEFRNNGYVRDVFGHFYMCNPNKAYKIVAFLIQGCGTGSLPKVCIRGLYDVAHETDVSIREAKAKGYTHYVPDYQRDRACLGILNGTTHDEISGRLSLDLGRDELLCSLRRMQFVMTEQFSPLFDNIPLRAKLYLSRTSAAEAKEVKLDKPETYEAYLN